MAKIETIQYICDRCHKEIPKGNVCSFLLPAIRTKYYTFGHSETLEKTETSASIDLCPKCRTELLKAIDQGFGKIRIRTDTLEIGKP